MDSLFFFGGIGIVAIALTDFIYTTLSCNGSGYLSTGLNRLLGKLLVPHSDGMRNWTGVIHLVASLLMWIILLLAGGFLVYLSDDEMVVRAATKVPATASERAYYTAFVFSTLGIGDYAPGNSMGRHVTAVYSLLGFGVLTTAITYILSVTGAVTQKKNLATFISGMGQTPSELLAYFTTDPDGTLFSGRIDDLVNQLNSHLNDHLSYPIVHYFHSNRGAWSAVIQLAALYECLVALRIRYRANPEVLAHADRLERSFAYFLEVAHIPDKLRMEDDGQHVQLRQQWMKEVMETPGYSPPTNENSRALGAVLRQGGYGWADVYSKD
ncbi:hypothetical protein GGR26_002097 [Lewinella marina]|nr:potassium channel family protein [Neolewinella marina]NJB86329.1 hypothetical protein [Neolewinella marina]